MDHDQFVGQVQARAHLSSRGDAERIIRSTLETLAGRLEGSFADNLAAQLPSEVGRHLRIDAEFKRMSPQEFFEGVLEREREGGRAAEPQDATYHARVVLEVLQLALSQGAVEKLRQQLPPEFEAVLSAGSQGKMPVKDLGKKNPKDTGTTPGQS